MEANLLIIGMGQYGMVANEIAQAMKRFHKIAFLDDNHPEAIGKLSDAKNLTDQYQYAVVAIGNAQLRRAYTEQLAQHFTLATLRHPMSYVSPSARIEEGCIVEPMAVVHTQAWVKQGSFISAGAVLNHNCVVCEYSHVDCNATVAARAQVPAGTKIRSGTFYENND